ncbi:hypothetical protein ACI1US_01502 [Leucobacter sp. BZR 635]
MSEDPRAAQRAARPRVQRGKIRRSALTVIGAAALVLGAAVPASASTIPPGAETPSGLPGALAGLEMLDTEAGAAAGLAASIEANGVPSTVEAGTPFPVEIVVSATLLGADAPTGGIALIAARPGKQIWEDYELLGTLDLTDGAAEIVVRPFGQGSRELFVVYGGDALYEPAIEPLEPFAVTPVNTAVSVDIDSNSPAYGGGTLGVWVTVESMCESQTDDADVRDLCESTHGAPHGEVTLKRDGVVVGTAAMPGTDRLGVPDWLDLEDDLSAPETSGIVRFDVPTPNRALGSPDRYTFTAEFTSPTWFGAAASAEVPVEARAAETSVELVLGDLESPVKTLKLRETVDLTAYVGVEPYWAGAADGVVNLWLNGEILVEGLTLAADGPMANATLSFDEPGSYTLVAEFVSHSLNHTGSKSAAYAFTVAAETPDGGKSDGSRGGRGSDAPATPVARQTELARTGGEPAGQVALGAGALLLAAAGAALLLGRRRGAGAE